LVGRLKIAVVSTGKYVMPYFLSNFMKLHNGINLTMDVTNKASVIESLEKNEVDFALVSVLPKKLKIETVQLMENRLFLVGKKKAVKKVFKSKKQFFEEIPLIYREVGSATRNAMEAFINKNKIPIYKKIELKSNEAVKQAVLAGLGYSILPLIGIKNELKNGDLEIIMVKGLPLKTFWNLIWLKSKNLSPAASSYLQFLKEEKELIISENFEWINTY
ncbi:LysR substrate-binding domain-containing protein, partial [Eudoraea sp.]|uniref:LysR substrate-binding domain-containing protein n=1 Tax=Eudoraea sp. TaxID=1979955 RepID=UPI003C7157AA